MVNVATTTNIHYFQSSRDQQFLIFDPWFYGCHPTYLRHLMNDWYRHPPVGRLDIVLLPSFLHEHADVVELAQQGGSIRFVATTRSSRRWNWLLLVWLVHFSSISVMR